MPGWISRAFKRSTPPPSAVSSVKDSPTASSEISEEENWQGRTRVPLDNITHPTVNQVAKQVWAEEKEDFKRTTQEFGWYEWLAFFIPFFGWIRTYQWKSWLYRDVLAGLSVAVMAIPQGMSYAQNLAYLPQVYGLYGCFVPCLLYGFLGSSRQLSVGPVAVTSLILGSGLTNIYGNFQINPSDPGDALQLALQDRYNYGAIQVAFIAGLFYTLVGLLRMGWIINFLSMPVISGFMTGAGSIILSGQIKYITGQKLPRANTLYDNLRLVFENLNSCKWREIVMGVSFMILLLVFKFLSVRYKKLNFLQFLGPLTVCIISIALMNIFKWYVFNPDIPGTPLIKPVGNIPRGMPQVTAGWWVPMYDPARQFPLALLICLLDIVESTTIARSLAIKNNYKLEGTQELRGLGLANLGGAIFNCYTTTGSFSRSAVNNDVGAKTQLAGMVTGLFIMITLLCLTEVFQNMSANVQGAIVIIGVFPLFDIAGFMYYWRINKLDWFCWVVCFIVTAFEGAEIGIASAIGASVVIFILKTAFPRIRSVAPVPGDENLYSSDKIYPGVDTSSLTQEGIIAIRVEAPLFFANAPFVRDNIEARILRAKQDGLDPKVVIMDLAPATDCDGSACIFFRDYLFELKRDGLQLVIANPTEAVLRAMDKAKLITSIGPQNFQATMPEAVSRAREIIAPKATEVEQKV